MRSSTRVLAASLALALGLGLSACSLVGEIDGSYASDDQAIAELHLDELGTVTFDRHSGAYEFGVGPTRCTVVEGVGAVALTDNLVELGWTLQSEGIHDLNGPVAGPDRPRLEQIWQHGSTDHAARLWVAERETGDGWNAPGGKGTFEADGLFLCAS